MRPNRYPETPEDCLWNWHVPPYLVDWCRWTFPIGKSAPNACSMYWPGSPYPCSGKIRKGGKVSVKDVLDDNALKGCRESSYRLQKIHNRGSIFNGVSNRYDVV